MPKSQFLQSSFASGELSPLILGRTDLDQYYKGGQTAENVVIVPQGGIKRRPGTLQVDTPLGALVRNAQLPSMPNGGNASFINDGNPLTYGITDTSWTGTFKTVAQYTFTSAPQPSFIDIKNISIINTGTAEQNATVKLQHGSDSTQWTDISSFVISDKYVTSKRVTFPNIVGYLGFRIVCDLTAFNTYAIKVGEFNLKTSVGQPTDVKTFDFSVGSDEHYLGVLTAKNLRVYRTPHAGSADTVFVADVVVPYNGAAVSEVRDSQTENVMLMFHKDYEPQRIIFEGNASFVSGPIPFSNVPQYDYNDTDSPTAVSAVQRITFGNGFVAGNRYQVDVQGVLSKNISFGGDVESTAFNLQKNLQEMPIFGDTGITVTGSALLGPYTITISNESAQPLKLFSAFVTEGATGNTGITFVRDVIGVSRKEDVWSSTRGFPLMGAFNEGRLWIGGTKSKRQSLFASKSGDLFNFFSEEGADDDGIFVTINSRNLTEIVDVNPDRGLQVFCSGAEFIVKGNTPSTIQIEAETQLGSFNLETKALDGATLFINGNGNTLRQYLYNFNEDAYTSNDISVLSSHLINKPLDMAALDGTSSEDSAWVFIVNEDGSAAVLNTVRAQDINGFTKWTLYNPDADNTTKYESCSVVGKELYLVVKSTNAIDVNTYKTIEKWDFNVLLDSAKNFTGVISEGLANINVGLRFAGQTVGAISNGFVLPNRNVTSAGIVIFSDDELGVIGQDYNIQIGLNFTSSFKSMPVNTNPGTRSGQNAMREKKITNMNLRVLETAGVYIDGIPVPVRELGPASNSPLNTPLSPKTGIIEDNRGGNGWSTEVVPLITVPGPTPFHLQSIEYEVESS
tara:strand:+ start:4476 stop:7025 length:2550 start_codon:yes stop_codon:yes gene_type:complete